MAGQKPADAGHVAVAGGLVDRALAAELGLDRLHGDAVRGLAAIAAALAHRLVDDDAHVRARVDRPFLRRWRFIEAQAWS